MRIDEDFNNYRKAESAYFMRSRDLYGELSNMTQGFPLQVSGMRFQGSEGLYQAFKFNNNPAHQLRIAEQSSGMDAKKVAYTNQKVRPDWDDIKADAMAYSLTQKLCQHPERFGCVLLATMDLPIVELVGQNRPDDYWGAKLQTDGTSLRGRNVLGKLLTSLRNTLTRNECGLAGTIREYLAEADLENLVLNGNPVQPPKWEEDRTSQRLREYQEHRSAVAQENTSLPKGPGPGDPGFWDWMTQRDAEREERECARCGGKDKLLPQQRYCIGCAYQIELGQPLPAKSRNEEPPQPEEAPQQEPFFDFSRLIPMETHTCAQCGNEYRCTLQAGELCLECEDLKLHPEKAPMYWTWTKMGGKWMIAAYWPHEEPLPTPGARVTVHRKNGSESIETISEVDGIIYENLTGRGKLLCWP